MEFAKNHGGTIGFLCLYAFSYIYLRREHTLVHYSSSCDERHEVKAAMPDGPFLLYAAIASGMDPNELILRKKVEVQILNVVYSPLRTWEELYWYQVT